MFNNYIRLSVFLIFILSTVLYSCTDEILSSNPDYKLAFSTDTLSFDTIFTAKGSTTEKILVYNRNNRALKISDISLAGGSTSRFRLNVDGLRNTENKFSNLEIRAKDSLYIFVEVTVDPKDIDAPVLVSDSILFNTNGNGQAVTLEAYGQDVVLWKNKFILNDTILSSARPYLIHGYLAVDSGKTLTLPAGCRLYFHNNAVLQVGGNLIVNGTYEKPVIMRGDRLDMIKYSDPFPYNTVAGQWGGVYLLWNKGQHEINHLQLTSAYVGLFANNADRNQLPSIEINNSRIHNFMQYAVVAQNTNLKITNSELSNTGSYTLYLSGGKHEILQSTIVNYYNSNPNSPSSRDKSPAVMIMGLNRTAAMTSIFKNCVITGGLENELSIASRFMPYLNGTFSNSYIRRKTAYDLPQFSNNRWYEKGDTLMFKSARYDIPKNQYFDFTPDSLSPLLGLADRQIAEEFPLDLNGNSRLEDGAPDAGAYEWIPTKK